MEWERKRPMAQSLEHPSRRKPASGFMASPKRSTGDCRPAYGFPYWAPPPTSGQNWCRSPSDRQRWEYRLARPVATVAGGRRPPFRTVWRALRPHHQRV